MRAWAFVPARGGSKSIPKKNLVRVAGIPLLDYGVRAMQASGCAERIICSTDDQEIADRALALGTEVARRPAYLSGDDVPVKEVVRQFLERDGVPDLIFLVQPTSLFLIPDHVRLLLDAIVRNSHARSGQTVTVCPHNYHAWNQRKVIQNLASFCFPEERRNAYSKQLKPKHYVFGNLVGVRSAELLQGADFFTEPSAAIEIPFPYAFDLDTYDDLAMAEALILSGRVQLPHMKGILNASTCL